MRKHILIVDDSEAIRSALSTVLQRLGYDVSSVGSGEAALQTLTEHEPDLILLDVVLDEDNPAAMSGIEVCQQVRQRPRFIPIIMLTSHPQWEVESLGQGAIAFIEKPWDHTALVTQIRSTLSAVQHIRHETQAGASEQVHVGAGIVIDLTHFRVSRHGQQIDLTPMEFALLAFLARHPGRPWTRDALLDHVWGDTWAGYTRTVDRHVAALRKKLKLSRDELIETVHGLGYRLVQL